MKFNKIIQKLKKKLNDSKGMALIATLIFTLVISTLGIALLTMTNNETKLTTLQKESSEAFYFADSGISRAINWLERQPSPPSESVINAISYLKGENWIDSEGYEYSEEVDDLDPGKYYKIEMSLAGGANFYQPYKIISTGKLVGLNRNATRVIEQLVDITNFAEYAYFSNIEASGIWFTDNDVIDGRLHTNGRLRIDGSPLFKGLVTSAESAITYAEGEPTEEEKDEIFLMGYELGPDQFIQLPQTRDISGTDNPLSLESISMGNWPTPSENGVYVPNDGFDNRTGGIYVKGNLDELSLTTTTVDSLSVMNFRQGGTNTTITLLPSGLPDPNNGTTYGSDKTIIKKGTDSPIYYNGLTNGLLYVNGKIKSLEAKGSYGGHQGKLTIVATEDITITNDIKYNSLIGNEEFIYTDDPDELSSITDTLGIISAGNIALDITSGIPQPLVCATMMALGESMYNVNNSRSPPGIFSLFGGLIQVKRGIMGHHNWNNEQISGYAKDYNFDERMKDPTSDSIPPYFPTTGNYEAIYWTESN